MIKSFFTITLRSLSRQGVFSVINILGLSIGLAVVVLISLLNFYERSFDQSFKESKNIYRVNAKMWALMPGETSTSVPNALAPTMQNAIPEVIAAVRTYRMEYNLIYKNNPVDMIITWVDSAFFRLFDTPFILGHPEDVMSRPNTIAISEQMAKTLFGNNNPLGETFSHHPEGWNQPPLEVVGVFKDYPENSSFSKYKVIAPFMHTYQPFRYAQLNWNGIDYETFFLLSANADTTLVHSKMQQALSDATSGLWEEEGFFYPQLQRLTDLHLHSTNYVGTTLLSSLSDIKKVKMMSLLSVIILLVACVNYMNLSTARAQKRSKEIGISKTVGAQRSDLIMRLTFETAIFTLISFIVALILTWALLPVFNNLMDERLSFGFALQPVFLCVVLFIWIVTTLLAASYPVLYISGFPPLMAIQSQSLSKSSQGMVRKILIVGQFTVAIVLIAWVLIIQKQIKFVNNQDLGYNYKNLIGTWAASEALAIEYGAENSVEMASRVSSNFFSQNISDNALLRSTANVLLKNSSDQSGISLSSIGVDANFIDLMQIKLIAGRHLPEQQQMRDTIIEYEGRQVAVRLQPNTIQILLNRAAVDYLGISPEEAIGKKVLAQLGFRETEVCGVVENFHFESLHRPIGAFCFHNAPNFPKYFLMFRYKEGDFSTQLTTYEKIFKKHRPNHNFSPIFPEDYVKNLYDGDRRTERIAVVFSMLAIFVACMGVFGLTAFMTEQRAKEIGIRKVMGASVWKIVNLFTGSYLKLLCISLFIAIPTAWWVGNYYLQNFAYRISLSWWIFALAALITIALTLLTVGVVAIKAAMANPMESIKTE